MASVAINILEWGEMSSANPTAALRDVDVLDIGKTVDAESTVYRGLIRFSLSTVPAGAVITAASLSVWQQANAVRPAGGIIDVYAPTKTWVIDQASWNEYATDADWATAGGDYTTAGATTLQPSATPASDVNLTSNVTAIVQAAYAAGEASASMLLKSRNETPAGMDNTTLFMSTFGQIPAITVTYDLPGDLEAALKEYLAAVSGVAGVLDDRIYVDEAPQGTAKPKAIISLSGRSHERHLTGGAGIARARVNITVTAATPEDRNRAAHAIKQALHGKPLGTIGTGANAIALRSCSFDDETANIIAPDDGGSLPDYERVLPFIIWHVESVPTFA